MIDALGAEALGRFMAALAHLGPFHQQYMPSAHWYLLVLGVDPSRQRQGLGGQLLQPIFRRADAAQLPCYLETMAAPDVVFYRRHGFEVAGETDGSEGGPHVWIMRRLPQSIAVVDR